MIYNNFSNKLQLYYLKSTSLPPEAELKLQLVADSNNLKNKTRLLFLRNQHNHKLVPKIKVRKDVADIIVII